MGLQWGNRGVILSGLVVAGLCVAGGAAVWAAQPSDRPTVDASMLSLVEEVRALREAVERSGLVTAQAQLLLGRVQLQEARLATLGRQAQEARERVAQAEREESASESELRQLTRAVNVVQNAEERDALINDRIPAIKEQVRRSQLNTQRMRNAEAAASSALAEEQSRWVDFNGRLESLERTVASILATRTRQ